MTGSSAARRLGDLPAFRRALPDLDGARFALWVDLQACSRAAIGQATLKTSSRIAGFGRDRRAATAPAAAASGRLVTRDLSRLTAAPGPPHFVDSRHTRRTAYVWCGESTKGARRLPLSRCVGVAGACEDDRMTPTCGPSCGPDCRHRRIACSLPCSVGHPLVGPRAAAAPGHADRRRLPGRWRDRGGRRGRRLVRVCSATAGLVIALVVFARMRRARLGPLLGLAIGGLAGAILAWRLGVLLGPASIRETVVRARPRHGLRRPAEAVGAWRAVRLAACRRPSPTSR